jgi:hypothetical protein
MELSRSGGGVVPLVKVCIEGRGPYPFVLDTGAPTSLVDTQLARSLRLPETGSLPAAAAIGCSSTEHRVRIGGWSVGHVELSPQNALTASVPGFRLKGAPVGILGGDVLGRFGAIRVDYRSRAFTVLAPEAQPPAGNRILRASPSLLPPPPLLVHRAPEAEVLLTVLETPASWLATASASLAGHTYQFVLDTGGAVSSVSSSVVGGLVLAKAAKSTASADVGCTERVDEVNSGPWSASGVSLPPTPLADVTLAGTSQNAVSGTIASDVLSRYGSVVIDYRTGILWLGTG